MRSQMDNQLEVEENRGMDRRLERQKDKMFSLYFFLYFFYSVHLYNRPIPSFRPSLPHLIRSFPSVTPAVYGSTSEGLFHLAKTIVANILSLCFLPRLCVCVLFQNLYSENRCQNKGMIMDENIHFCMQYKNKSNSN